MATVSERLQVILELVTGQYKREAREAATATGQIAREANTAGTATGRFSGAMGGLATTAKAVGAAFAVAAIGKFARDSVQAASALEESVNAVNKTFGEASSTIEAFGQVSAQAVGLSTREFNQLGTLTGSMLTNLGFNQAEAAKETIRLTQRASDLASVFDTDVGTALAAINSALKGEANPIEQFGIKLTDADIRARAVALGLAETTSAVDANAKATATLNLIYEQSAKVQGDFIQTSDSLANSQRRAAAALENAQARLGKAVTPALAGLLDRLGEGIERVSAAFGDEAARNSIVFGEAIKGLQDELAAGSLGTEDLANAILHMATNADLTTGEVEALAAAAGLGSDQWDIFAESMLEQAEAMGVAPEVIEEISAAIGGIGRVSGDAAAGIEEVGDAAGGAAGNLRSAADAQRDFLSALKEAASPAFAAAAAVGRYQAAQDKLADVLDDSKSSEQDIAEAKLAVAEAAIEAQIALDAFDGSGVVRAADAIATALGIGRDEALDLLEQLNLIDGKEVNAVITITQRDIITRRVEEEGRTVIGGRQHGGSVFAGRPYLVGERGRELIIPGASGQVFSNSATERILAALSGGGQQGSVSVAVNYPQHTGDDVMHGVRYGLALAGLTRFAEVG